MCARFCLQKYGQRRSHQRQPLQKGKLLALTGRISLCLETPEQDTRRRVIRAEIRLRCFPQTQSGSVSVQRLTQSLSKTDQTKQLKPHGHDPAHVKHSWPEPPVLPSRLASETRHRTLPGAAQRRAPCPSSCLGGTDTIRAHHASPTWAHAWAQVPVAASYPNKPPKKPLWPVPISSHQYSAQHQNAKEKIAPEK